MQESKSTTDEFMEIYDIRAGGAFTDKKRSIWIVTTACLPWKTGTSINPLLRALYLLKYYRSSSECAYQPNVYLMVPWLEKAHERKYLYGDQAHFEDGARGKIQQANFIRDWAKDSAKMNEEARVLKITFYPAQYHKSFGSIFPSHDICSLIPDSEADLAILEEPEHLNWIPMPTLENDTSRSSKSWSEKFHHVVGIIHTNYPAYAKGQGSSGLITSTTIHSLSTLVVRSYCHNVVLLSGTLPSFGHPQETICNIHGVRSEFLERESCASVSCNLVSTKIYFIGKLLWSGKGFDSLLECEQIFKDKTGKYFPIDIFGAGPDEQYINEMFGLTAVSSQSSSSSEEKLEDKDGFSELSNEMQSAILKSILASNTSLREYTKVERISSPHTLANVSNNDELMSSCSLLQDLSKSVIGTTITTSCSIFSIAKAFFFGKTKIRQQSDPIPARLLGVIDHARISKHYKIFLNTSITEVLCTTTSEALAMGDKWVIIPKHPSNDFFARFSNCLTYSNLDEFVDHLKFALINLPNKISLEELNILSWESAINRLMFSVLLSPEHQSLVDERLRWIHKESRNVLSHDVIMKFYGFHKHFNVDEYLQEY